MLTGLYSAATGINAAELNQRVIAENLAYLDTPGYRRQTLGFESFEMQLAQPDPRVEGGRLGTQPMPIHRDFSVGQVKLTGRSLDVALDGDGFFAVESADGEIYTRSGVFQIDPEGTLQTSAGYPVLSENGGRMVIPAEVPESDIRITSDGQVSAGSLALGKLRIVQFPDNQSLQLVGVALFRAPEGMQAGAAEAVAVQQGYRELSNVSGTTELVRMIVGVRQHENAQRALTALSDAIEQRVRGQP